MQLALWLLGILRGKALPLFRPENLNYVGLIWKQSGIRESSPFLPTIPWPLERPRGEGRMHGCHPACLGCVSGPDHVITDTQAQGKANHSDKMKTD